MRKKVVLYDVELDDLKHPKLVARKRRTYETEDDEPFDHIAVARMLCKCFRLADMAEEYIYAMAFTTRGGCWGFLNWRTALAGLREAEAAQPADQEVDDSHHGMLSSGYFHV